jgi:hypothetical protein
MELNPDLTLGRGKNPMRKGKGLKLMDSLHRFNHALLDKATPSLGDSLPPIPS